MSKALEIYEIVCPKIRLELKQAIRKRDDEIKEFEEGLRKEIPWFDGTAQYFYCHNEIRILGVLAKYADKVYGPVVRNPFYFHFEDGKAPKGWKKRSQDYAGRLVFTPRRDFKGLKDMPFTYELYYGRNGFFIYDTEELPKRLNTKKHVESECGTRITSFKLTDLFDKEKKKTRYFFAAPDGYVPNDKVKEVYPSLVKRLEKENIEMNKENV
jgi:hypothetical protein